MAQSNRDELSHENEDELTKLLVGFANDLLAYEDRMERAGSPILFIHKYVAKRHKMFQDFLEQDRKQHELDARIDELEENMSWQFTSEANIFKYIKWQLARIAELKKEREQL